MMRWLAIASVLVLCTSAHAVEPDAADQDAAGELRAGDQMWRISTREMKKLVEDASDFETHRFDEGRWTDADLKQLLAPSEQHTETIVYVHGYGFDPAKADRIGWEMYEAMVEELGVGRRVRFVSWSWPSTAQRFKLVRDYRDKAKRTNAESFYLAWVLNRLDGDARVTVIGSAMGCRAVTGSLHLARGDNPALQRPDGLAAEPKIRAILISPALHNDWLYPDKAHGQAVTRTERMMLLNNADDPTLARYALMYTRTRPVALGITGIKSLEDMGDLASRIKQVDASPVIGEAHGVENYLKSEELVEHMRSFAFE